PGHVADGDRAARVQVRETVVAVRPRHVPPQHAVVRAGLDLAATVLVVVQPVALDHVAGRAGEVDAGGPRFAEVEVRERLVAVDHRPRHAVPEQDAVVLVVGDDVAGHLEVRSALCGDAARAALVHAVTAHHYV